MQIDNITDSIILTLEEYDNLMDEVFFLECLRSSGVDNWEGYDEARKMYKESF